MSYMVKDNGPNAGKLVEALRHSGYDNYGAISDIVDNSFDADSDNVWINIEPKEDNFLISIADDGSGMDSETLEQALKLGSDTERNQASDLGKFGMGLVTASISMGRRIKVITCDGSSTITGIFDIDEIINANSFCNSFGEADKDDVYLFHKYTNNSNTGTLVLISKCDRIQNHNVNVLLNKLKADLAQTFRIFIDSASKNIFIRDVILRPNDPLMSKVSEIYSDETFTVNMDGKTEDIRLRIAMLPQNDAQTDTSLKINQANQGFYLLRNNREVASGETLGVFNKHNDYNRFRAEVYFSGALDEAMGVNYTKKSIKPNQAILDKIIAITLPQLRTIKKKWSIENPKVKSGDIDHNTASKLITSKAKLLIKPKATIESRKSGAEKNVTTKTNAEPSYHRKAYNVKEALSSQVEFLTRSMGESGPYLDFGQVGRVIQITFNVEHPFYQEVYAANKENQELINALDYLAFSMGSAYLMVASDNDAYDILDNQLSIFSSNLRTLIK